MPLPETMLLMCSLWYDHANVKIFHVMRENCEEKLCSWVKIGAKNMLSGGATNSGLKSQSPGTVAALCLHKHQSTQVDEIIFTT